MLTSIIWGLGALRGNLANLIAALSLMALATSSSVLVISCVSRTTKAAIQAAPAILVPQMLFSGFFIRITSIPKILQWAQYLCSLKYGLNLVTLVEFRGCHKPACTALLQDNQIHANDVWIYVAILAALTVAFRALAVFVLYDKALGFKG